MDKKRRDCINELIRTEGAYIEDMRIVHDIFEIPLVNSGVIDKKHLEIIFVNWEDILLCNKNFLEDLLQRVNSGNDIIGDVIYNHLPRMTAYITFCSKQLESAALLQRLTETSVAFRDVVRKCQNNIQTKGMPLSSFLIKPMQRITKYPLLIVKILENTPDNHTDRAYLEEALRVAEAFLKRVNENVRLQENHERLYWLQCYVQNDLNIDFNSETNKLGPRKLLHFGILTKVKSGKELIGFLLNDFLLLVQPGKSMNSSQFTFSRNNNVTYRIYKQPLLIQELNVSKDSVETVENGTDSNRILKVQDKKQTILFMTPSANECNLWIKRIQTAIEAYNMVISTSKYTSQPRDQTQHLLNVLVSDGTEIYSSGYSLWIKKGKLYVDNVYCKVVLGHQEQFTDIGKDSMMNGNGPSNGLPQVPTLIWNCSMQFYITNIANDVLKLFVYEMCSFKPDVFLGSAEVKIQDIYKDMKNTNGAIIKKLVLHHVESGEVTLKLDLQLFS